jgi:hypothetical protein
MKDAFYTTVMVASAVSVIAALVMTATVGALAGAYLLQALIDGRF